MYIVSVRYLAVIQGMFLKKQTLRWEMRAANMEQWRLHKGIRILGIDWIERPKGQSSLEKGDQNKP